MPVMGYPRDMTSTEIVPRTLAEVSTAPGADRLRNLTAAWLLGYGSANTRAAYLRDLTAWTTWAEDHGVDPLAAGRPHLDAWARVLESEGLRPTTVARRLAAVSSFYRYAVSMGVLAGNPAADVRRPHTSEGYVDLTPALDRSEVSALLAAATAPRDRALVLLLAVQALRVSEALSLDIDRAEIVRGHTTYLVTGKGGRQDRIPVPPVVMEALSALAASEGRTSGPVFVGENGERLSRHGVARALTRLGKAAGISRSVRPHMLRATSITLALDAGVSLRDVQDLARHSDPRTTRRYDRNRGALDRHAAYTLAGVVSEAVAS